MEQIRSYIDSGLIIDALNIFASARKYRAMVVLDDKQRNLLTSDYVWLETVPKMEYQKMTEQLRYAAVFFDRAEFVPSTAAHSLGKETGHNLRPGCDGHASRRLCHRRGR